MSPPGEPDPVVVGARRALLDALDALGPLREAVVLVGAQAIYLHTGEVSVAVAPFTTDADIVFDTERLADDPRIEEAMRAAGFLQSGASPQPGAWTSADGVPVDLMIAEAQAGGPGRRGVRVPPHASTAARRALGLEGALVDNVVIEVLALDVERDRRVHSVLVAGPAALLVAKLHKIAERLDAGRTVAAKDAHDIYRLLVALSTADLAEGWRGSSRLPCRGSWGALRSATSASTLPRGPTRPGRCSRGGRRRASATPMWSRRRWRPWPAICSRRWASMERTMSDRMSAVVGEG